MADLLEWLVVPIVFGGLWLSRMAGYYRGWSHGAAEITAHYEAVIQETEERSR